MPCEHGLRSWIALSVPAKHRYISFLALANRSEFLPPCPVPPSASAIDYPSQLGSLPHVPRLPPCIHTWISPKSSEPRVRACGDKSLLGLVHKEHKDTSTQ